MTDIKKYKSLLKDTIVYLKNSDLKFFESKDPFFKTKLISKKNESLNKEDSQKPSSISSSDVNKSINTSSPSKAMDFSKSIPNESDNKYQPLTNQIPKNEIEKENSLPTHISNQQIIPTLDNIKLDKLKDYETNKEPDKKITHEDKNQQISFEIPKNNNETEKNLENKTIKRDVKLNFTENNFSDVKSILKKIRPNLSINEEILDDKIAKQKAQKYILKNISSDITILAFKENEETYKFLENISIALNTYFLPTKVVSAYSIEKQNNWDIFLSENDIKLIISSDYTIFELPHLRKFYKENPSKQEKYLKTISLFLLPDISIYFKEPSLKFSLFKALEKKIKEIQ